MIATDSFEALFRDGRAADVDPLWVRMKDVVTPQPRPRAVPHVWDYETVRALLLRAGKLVAAEDAERRVFMLTNPALQPPCCSDTLFAGLQYILPGEIAPAHRHTSFALRFIVEGDGAYTAVNGEKVIMHRGDLVLTPSWMWHDHGNETDEPMIWLDGLPLPMLQAIPANFAEPFGEPRYPSLPAARDSNLIYPWPEMQRRLDAIPMAYAQQGYTQRLDGSPIGKIIGASAERLEANTSVRLPRQTTCAIYSVFAGSGETIVNGTTLRWKARDTFVAPAWAEIEHRAGDERVYLFRFDDKPMLDALGLFRAEPQGPEHQPQTR
jgi:gentisate 1,2-dioxygenase